MAELFDGLRRIPARTTQGGQMSSARNPGRVAGFIYLVLSIIAPFRLMYIPNALFVRGNATATANNIVGGADGDPGGCAAIRHRLLQRAERRGCHDAGARRRFLVRIRPTAAQRAGPAVPPSA